MLKIQIIVGAFLLLMAILDVKKKRVPAILSTTAILFLVISNYFVNPDKMFFGIAGFVYAFLLYEFMFIQGRADIKAIIIIAFTLATLKQFFAMMVLIPLFGLVYQVAIKKVYKIKDKKEIPFIPVFLFVYIALHLLIHLT